MDLQWILIGISLKSQLDFQCMFTRNSFNFLLNLTRFPLNLKWISFGILLKFQLVFKWKFWVFHWNCICILINISLKFQLDFQWISIDVWFKFPLVFQLEIHYNVNSISNGFPIVFHDFFHWISTVFPL